MAMTKKEQAEMQALRDRVAFLEAQLPQEIEEPKPYTPDEIRAEIARITGNKYGGGFLPGWFCNTYYATDINGFGGGRIVTHGCSSGYSHSRDNPTKTTSQRCGEMFRTELDALLYARVTAYRAFMTKLAIIDTLIREARRDSK